MENGIYGALAPIYDELQSDIDYSRFADLYEKAFSLYFDTEVKDVLDLGCGTGSLTLELCRRGYDMIGVDSSPEMLSVARNAGEEQGLSERLLWLCQDMRSFELYGTVEATVSCLDCINHLTSPKDVEKCFSLVHNYLVPNGLFIFDVNSPYKFKNVYANNSYVFERDSYMCVWQNYYNEKTRLCDFYISLFSETEDGTYERTDEIQRERMYTLRSLESMLKKTGFSLLCLCSDKNLSAVREDDERIYLIAKAIK